MSDNIYLDIEETLIEIDKYLPTVIEFGGVFNPHIAALMPFLPLIKVAIKGVDLVAKATGHDTGLAMQEVMDTLTPGAPNSPTLTGVPPVLSTDNG